MIFFVEIFVFVKRFGFWTENGVCQILNKTKNDEGPKTESFNAGKYFYK